MAKKVKIKSKKPQGIGSKIFDVVNYLLLAILGFIMFYPMFYVFIVSISSSQYINQGLVTLFPRGINFDAYKAVFENQRIWNSYFPSMLYLNDQKKYPVQVVMRDIVIQGDTSEITGSVNIIATNYKYAVIIISIVPILLVYPLLQKYFTKGVMVGAVKG